MQRKQAKDTIKVKWTKQEDELLREAVRTHGTANWHLISTLVKSRNGKQCRERWTGQISPNLSKEIWSSIEDAQLIRLQKAFGNKWKEISQQLPNRSPTNVKNRWYWLSRHGIPDIPQQNFMPQQSVPARVFDPIEFDDSKVFGEAFTQFSEHVFA